MNKDKNKDKGKKQEEKRNAFRLLTLVTQFGINMLVPIFLCFFAGLYLDRYFGTSFLIIIFFFIGAVAGFTNIYKLAMKLTKKSDKEILLEEINKKTDSSKDESDK